VKIFWRATKRGPGVEGMGNDGGGDGEDVGEATLGGGMACITSSRRFPGTTMSLREVEEIEPGPTMTVK